jgi:hypothetical protein
MSALCQSCPFAFGKTQIFQEVKMQNFSTAGISFATTLPIRGKLYKGGALGKSQHPEIAREV